MEHLKRFLRPVTWGVLIAMVAEVLVSLIRLVSNAEWIGSVSRADQGVSGVFGLAEAAVLTALVIATVLFGPRDGRSVPLAAAATILVAFGTVAGLVMLIVAVVGSGAGGTIARVLELIGGATDVALKALAAWLLLHAWRASKERIVVPEAEQAAEIEPRQTEPEPGGPATVWAADEAVGVAWRRAADAAAGAPVSGSGVPESAAEPDAQDGPAIVRGGESDPAPRTAAQRWDPADDVTRRDRPTP